MSNGAVSEAETLPDQVGDMLRAKHAACDSGINTGSGTARLVKKTKQMEGAKALGRKRRNVASRESAWRP